MEIERQLQLIEGLRNFKQGLDPDRNPIDLVRVSAECYQASLRFADNYYRGQRIANQHSRDRKYIG